MALDFGTGGGRRWWMDEAAAEGDGGWTWWMRKRPPIRDKYQLIHRFFEATKNKSDDDFLETPIQCFFK